MIRATQTDARVTLDRFADDRDEVYRLLDRRFRYKVEGYEYAPAYQAHRWDGWTHLVKKASGVALVVPLGIWPECAEVLAENGVEFEHVDERRPVAPLDGDVEWVGPTLRDYQREARDAAIASGSGVLKLPTRAGKTLIAASIAHALRLRSIFVVPSEMLLRQTAAAFAKALSGLRVSTIGDGEWDSSGDVVVATIQTLSAVIETRRFRTLSRSFDIAFIDECFPAGTLVDGVPIEAIREGDLVTAYDPDSGSFSSRRVARTFKRPAPGGLVTIATTAGTVSCTPNHPFFTRRGWAAAGVLDVGEMVAYATGPTGLDERGGDEAQGDSGEVRRVRLADRDRGIQSVSPLRDDGPGVLLGSLQKDLDVPPLVRNDGPHESSLRVGEDAQAQPDARPRSARGRDCESSGSWLACRRAARGERARADERAIDVGTRSWLGDRSSCADGQGGSREGIPALLQDRRSESGREDSRRDRWIGAHLDARQASRRAQGRVLAWARVESITIQESGSDIGSSDGDCLDYVYNLEVEGVHTYTANGFVVHNCHHLSGQGDAWRAAANAIEARHRFGLSATVGLDPVGENDATDVWLRAVCGPIVYEVAISTLIEAGYLVRPTIRFLRHGAPDLPYDRWSTRAYADGISKCEKRNERIVAEAARYAGRGLRVLVDVARVGHARALANACAKALPPGRVALLLGTSSGDERAAVVASWRRGEVLVVVGTILGEGVDIPELSVVINAEGGKANVSGLQRLRNLTLSPGKTEAIVVEFLDTHHPHLCDWTARRLALYRRERAFKIEAEPKGAT